MPGYSDFYYGRILEKSRESAEVLVPLVLSLVHPTSVVDVGCGTGAFLSTFERYGVTDVLGIDGDYVKRKTLLIPEDKFMPFDLTRPLQLDRTFDLVMCLEVVEHLPPEVADTLVDSLVRLGNLVLFSAAVPFQGGKNHVNEQWPDYWAEKFGKRGYAPVDCIRKRVWQDSRVEWWYSQNALLYVKREELERNPPLLYEFERTNLTQLSLVHPNRYLISADFTRPLPKLIVEWLRMLREKFTGRR